MLVYAATPKQFEYALNQWTLSAEREHRLRVKAVLDQFMGDELAKPLRTETGLFCFTYPDWQIAFTRWRDHAIRRQPQQLEKIQYWTRQVSALLQSDWGLTHKLVVRECLQELLDIEPCVEADLFDALVNE